MQLQFAINDREGMQAGSLICASARAITDAPLHNGFTFAKLIGIMIITITHELVFIKL